MSPRPRCVVGGKIGDVYKCRVAIRRLIAVVRGGQSVCALGQKKIALANKRPLFRPSFIVRLLQRLPSVRATVRADKCTGARVFGRIASLTSLVLFSVGRASPRVRQGCAKISGTVVLRGLTLLYGSKQSFVVQVPLVPNIGSAQRGVDTVLRGVGSTEGLVHIRVLECRHATNTGCTVVKRACRPPFSAKGTPRVCGMFRRGGVGGLVM